MKLFIFLFLFSIITHAQEVKKEKDSLLTKTAMLFDDITKMLSGKKEGFKPLSKGYTIGYEENCGPSKEYNNEKSDGVLKGYAVYNQMGQLDRCITEEEAIFHGMKLKGQQSPSPRKERSHSEREKHRAIDQ